MQPPYDYTWNRPQLVPTIGNSQPTNYPVYNNYQPSPAYLAYGNTYTNNSNYLQYPNGLYSSNQAANNYIHSPMQYLNQSDTRYNTYILNQYLNQTSNSEVVNYDYRPIWFSNPQPSVSFDPFKHRRILETLKSSVNSSNVDWTCRTCFYTGNPIHVNQCKACNAPRFSSLPQGMNGTICPTTATESPESHLTLSDGMNLLSLEDNTSNRVESSDFWSCRKCTLENSFNVSACDACQMARHKNARIPKQRKTQQEDSELKTKNDLCLSSSSSGNVIPWTCAVCTFENRRTTVICDLCQTISNNLYDNPSEEPKRLSNEEIVNLEWNYIVSHCKLEKKIYTDKAFPPALSSLYYFPELHEDDKTKWLRLRNVQVDEYDRVLQWTLFRDVLEPSDVYQGILSNCWFMGALIVLIEQADLIRSLFITKELCSQGIYQIRLCKDGVWTSILIDDFVPCDEDGYLCFAKTKRKQLWVPLIEKAAAKVYGCYESLYMGSVTEALNLLTGAPCEDLCLHPDDLEGIDVNFVWYKLISSRQSFFLMIAICGASCMNIEETQYDNVGLYFEHMYSILEVCEIQEHRLLKLRDPYGDDTWNGDWSENSNYWTPYLRGKLEPQGFQSGAFWIRFEDFMRYFYSVGLCRIRREWNEKIFSGTFTTFERQDLTCISLIVLEPTELDITLYQDNLRNFESNQRYYMDLSLVLFKKVGSCPSSYKFLGYSSRLHQAFISFCKKLDPGEYVLVPISFNHWHSEMINNPKYSLTIQSSEIIFAESMVLWSLTLRDAIVSLVRSCGEVRNLLVDLKMYVVKKEFCGLITLIENHSKTKWAHLKCTDDKDCFNIVCSRGRMLKVADSIPPQHGQILAIYTRLKYDLTFNAVHELDYRLSDSPGLGDWGENDDSLHVPEVTEADIMHYPFALQE